MSSGECSNLNRAWTKPINDIRAWVHQSLKVRAQFDSLVKPNSSSISSFWTWNPTQVYYQIHIKSICLEWVNHNSQLLKSLSKIWVQLLSSVTEL